ncbi:MAG: DUF3373 domain-containing protein [Sulfurimonas sp.]|uniref:DUF3373 family protein n=1 Tax=Sulfurimonas sp. TaxID=2022749 RepID=UPI0025FBCEF3|nr:DUF3373 family protein [Sulfurimonas sp.]MCK9492043.1 DUF3373 domain-containing protein [Sulfurimonas sp.]
MKKVLSIATVALLSSSLLASPDVQTQIDELTKELQDLKKDHTRTRDSLSEVKSQSANDNIKFGIDFRNAVDVLEYKNNDTGEKFRNHSLLSSRLFLTMKASPMDGLAFFGNFGVYSTWGADLYHNEGPLKDWSASSKASDSVMRIKEAYFVYKNKVGSQPYTFSIGRRPATNGFLANFRENEPKAGSPLAHITNMEVNGVMLKLGWDRFITGAYSKLVYGRAHTGEGHGVYGEDSAARFPYATTNDKEDENVDFFVFLGDAYNNGQYQVMYQWAHIFDTKGENPNLIPDPVANPGVTLKKGSAGYADLFSLGLKVDGVGDEISDFLDSTTLFASVAYTNYNAKSGHKIMGSSGSTDGQSFWVGAVIPDMITESGKFGFEYNQGSKYWTPMTWAEDTAMGSKVAVRGSAYEAYWNFDLFGVKYLPSQIRYTYAQHDYTPNINCAGWVEPKKVDITSSDIRFAVSYRY